ncbi:MAG: hypothetical protein M4579_001711, partial [Chaenotheca gracillima]
HAVSTIALAPWMNPHPPLPPHHPPAQTQTASKTTVQLDPSVAAAALLDVDLSASTDITTMTTIIHTTVATTMTKAKPTTNPPSEAATTSWEKAKAPLEEVEPRAENIGGSAHRVRMHTRRCRDILRPKNLPQAREF